MSRPWVLVDASYLGHRALHTVGHLEHDEVPTGVAFGVFTQLRAICEDPKVRSSRVGLFFDSKSSLRKVAFPDYKKKRRDDRTEEERRQVARLYRQLYRLRRDVFPKVGIPCYVQPGLESDDLMVQASQWAARRGEDVVLVTGDGDLYQAISKRVSWFDHGRRKFYTPESFEADRGIDPAEWGRVKVLAGCHTDNVPGIPGVGEKTAVKYLLERLSPKHKTYESIESFKWRAVRERNRGLVLLPHAKTKKVELVEPRFDVEAFFRWCKDYGIKSFLRPDTRASWKAFLLHGPVGFKLRKVGER